VLAENELKATGQRMMIFQKAKNLKGRLDKTETKL
jgi:hypothetical protein